MNQPQTSHSQSFTRPVFHFVTMVGPISNKWMSQGWKEPNFLQLIHCFSFRALMPKIQLLQKRNKTHGFILGVDVCVPTNNWRTLGPLLYNLN